MKRIIRLGMVASLTTVSFGLFGQWNPTGFNYTTDRLAIGATGWSGKRLFVQGNDADHIALFENTGASGFGLWLRAANDPLRIVGYGSNNYLFVVNGNGYVGVGTNSPQTRFDVNSATSGSIATFGSSIASNSSITVKNSVAGMNIGIGSTGWTSGYGYLWTNSQNFMIGNDGGPTLVVAGMGNGNVGIGGSPISKLTLGSDVATMLSTNGITLGGANNSIELLHSSYGLGYGSKIYGTDQGAGLTSLRIAVRGNGATWTDAIYVKAGDNGAGGGNLGYVGIGTNTPDSRLSVNGTVHSKEVKVDLLGWPDYVLSGQYSLRKLSEVENFIHENQHLPDMPSAEEVETEGLKLGEMNALLLKKVEELTLYIINQEKRIVELEKKVSN